MQGQLVVTQSAACMHWVGVVSHQPLHLAMYPTLYWLEFYGQLLALPPLLLLLPLTSLLSSSIAAATPLPLAVPTLAAAILIVRA